MNATPFTVGDILVRLGAILALVLVNGFFVAAEFSLVTVRRTRVDQLVAEGNRFARTVQRALQRPDRYIATTQLGITMASLGLGWIGEPAVASVIEPFLGSLPPGAAHLTSHSLAVAISFALITAVTIVLGELAPKTVALQRPERTSLLVAGPTMLFMKLFWPFIVLLNGLGRAVVGAFGLHGPAGHALVHSEEELKMLVTASQEAGVLEEDEEQMLHRVFGFGDLTAGQVMVPRTEMMALPVTASTTQVTERVAESPYGVLPVYREGLDDIVGLVSLRDLFTALATDREHFTLESLVREALTVPETLKADDLLNEMRRRRTHQAIVIDEHGGTAGMVTFDRLMERIVGEIGDEQSGGSTTVSVLTDGSALVDGLAFVPDINAQFGLHIDEDVYNTIGGYVMGCLGRRPRLGDVVETEGKRLRVEALDGLRVARVLITKKG
jgi:CBS domain containing-hemolysin-like protein